eukprot:363164-Chlamydomonas_euryale.AAC.3
MELALKALSKAVQCPGSGPARCGDPVVPQSASISPHASRRVSRCPAVIARCGSVRPHAGAGSPVAQLSGPRSVAVSRGQALCRA